MNKECRGELEFSMKKEKGITLIALIITIIILVILAAVSINAAYNSGIVNYAVNGTENYIETAEKEKSSIKNAQTVLENALLSANPYVSEKGVNTPKITEGMIPIKWNGEKWVVCARDDAEWYDYASATEIANDETRTMSWANMMLSDGTYKSDTVKVGQVVDDDKLGSMFVWIPRYAYSMKDYKTSFTGTDGETQNITSVVFLKGTTNEDANGNRYARSYEADSQTVGGETEMIVHPAFTFGGKELTGIWVAKFEASQGTDDVVKVLPNVTSWRSITIGDAFSVSYNMRNKTVDNKNVYGITENTNTHLMKNSEWGAVVYLAASQYGKIPTLNANTSYYTAGSNTSGGYKIVNLTQNLNYPEQSTTGTVHGVYDLNGGAYERVAAFYDNEADNLENANPTSGTAVFEKDTSDKYKLKSEWIAYWDKYDVYRNPQNSIDIDGSYGFYFNSNSSGLTGNQANQLIAEAAYMKVQLMKSKKGDAMYEVINDNSLTFYGWLGSSYTGKGYHRATWNENRDLTIGDDTRNTYAIGYYDQDIVCVGVCIQPFIMRGGYHNNSNNAGVFYVDAYGGGAGSSGSFRPVLW